MKTKEIELYRSKEEFQWIQKNLVICMKEVNSWQKMDLIGFILSFLINVFDILLFFCHRKVTCDVLMTLDDVFQVVPHSQRFLPFQSRKFPQIWRLFYYAFILIGLLFTSINSVSLIIQLMHMTLH